MSNATVSKSSSKTFAPERARMQESAVRASLVHSFTDLLGARFQESLLVFLASPQSA